MSRTEAASRFMTAYGYLEAIRLIREHPNVSEEQVVFTVLPLNMLAGFALELLFKAWLLEAGVPSLTVIRFGHRIADLFAETERLGLPKIDNLDALVAALGPGHGDFTFRYIDSGTLVDIIVWPNVMPVFEALKEVVEAKIAAAGGIPPGQP